MRERDIRGGQKGERVSSSVLMHSALSWRPQAAQTLLVRPRRMHMHGTGGTGLVALAKEGATEEEDGEETTFFYMCVRVCTFICDVY